MEKNRLEAFSDGVIAIIITIMEPGSVEGIRMEIGDRTFNPIEFWLTASKNVETEKIDLTAWHPLFEKIPEKEVG